jgi:hypothetical protein
LMKRNFEKEKLNGATTHSMTTFFRTMLGIMALGINVKTLKYVQLSVTI